MLRVASRREAIRVLLLHLADVRHGLWDGRAEGGGPLLMCSVWNSPAYRRLERLLPQLRRAEPRSWRAVHALYEQPSFRRRAWCPRCGGVAPPDHIGFVHWHGRRTVPLQPRMVRQPRYPVAEVDVARAVRWLDEHWGGVVFIPDELRDIVAVA
jgi:hypothetical protein